MPPRAWVRQPEPRSGQLLVSTPLTDDPNFARTVVLVVEHDAEGSLGLVLNRPADRAIPDPLQRWIEHPGAALGLFAGGPVDPDALLAVGSHPSEEALGSDTPDRAASGSASLAEQGWREGRISIDPVLSLIDLTADPAQLLPRLHTFRVFSGYSGWGPGQLRSELGVDGWWVIDRRPDDLRADPGFDLWTDVVRRTRELRRFSTLPADPSLN